MFNLPDGIGVLLPTRDSCSRGSQTLHAFKVLERAPYSAGGRLYRSPAPKALCGIAGWRESEGEVSCKNCLRILASYATERAAG